MTRFAPAAVALATILAASASPAQTFTDPANLRGERVSPRTGRELPIDVGNPAANDPAPQTLALQQQLRRIGTRASMMLIVAHPDDEDGGMLTFYSRGLGARVAVLTLTRGEGGQNAMTGDFEDALGLLRTQELLSADRYSGVQQMFGTEVDFGFSKTKAEAFAKWGHERVLYDAVRAVRLFRPLVIAAVFTGSVTDGHGQHQVSGQIAQEVFKAAADPNVFPELTREGILPWQPLKVYARVPMQAITDKGLFDYATGQYVPAQFRNYVTRETFTTPPAPDVVIHEGQTDPLLTYAAARPEDLRSKPAVLSTPLSYVQFARIGLGLQRSQVGSGMRVPPSGTFDVAYHRYASRLPDQPLHETSFFDAIDITPNGWVRLAPAADNHLREQIALLAVQLSALPPAFDQDHDPDTLAPKLAEALTSTNHLLSTVTAAPLPEAQRSDLLHELRVKAVQLNDALALALRLDLDASAPADPSGDVTLGSALDLHLKLTAAHPGLAQAASHWTLNTAAGTTLPLDGTSTPRLTEGNVGTRAITQPYFLRQDRESAVYMLREPQLRNAAATPPAMTVSAEVPFRSAHVQIARVVHSGEQAVSIVPPVSVNFSRPVGVIPLTATEPYVWLESQIPLTKCAQWERDVANVCAVFQEEAQASLVPAKGWGAEQSTHADSPEHDRLKQYFDFDLRPPQGIAAGMEFTAKGAVSWHGQNFDQGYQKIGYKGLPRTNLFSPAIYRARVVDLKSPAPPFWIGYIEGTGDDTFDSLFALYGGHIQRIDAAGITPENLKRFDTVVLGVRTYAAHPELHGEPTRVLLEYARNGGNVVVQYQTTEFTSGDAPFPLSLGSNEKVVDETAPAHLLDPANPLLSTPNTITEADFNNWLEERGHGFLSSWDSHYTVLTETQDPGEPSEFIQPQAPQRGGLITTPLGKGRWTYVAFALYRQLPEGVPGAFRLFVNLITPPAH